PSAPQPARRVGQRRAGRRRQARPPRPRRRLARLPPHRREDPASPRAVQRRQPQWSLRRVASRARTEWTIDLADVAIRESTRGMTIEVDTKDCTSLGDTELEEMADICAEGPAGYDIGLLSKQRDEWVLVTQVREAKLLGFSF